MGRNKTILLEESLSMGRMDVSGNENECVKSNQTEENVCPSSYISIVVDGQDEHDTIRSNGRTLCRKKGSTVENRPSHKCALFVRLFWGF